MSRHIPLKGYVEVADADTLGAIRRTGPRAGRKGQEKTNGI